MLELKSVTKCYGDKTIFEDVSFSVQLGQSVVLTAPSGMGKSTLLSIAGLLLQPTEGEVILDDVNTEKLNRAQLAHMRAECTGFMFQHTQLLGSLRAVENVELGDFFLPKRAKGSEIRTRSEELLRQMGLDDWKYYYPSQLSVGQKRRVATARALVSDPKLIIADEPTNDLDDECVRIVTDALFEPVRQGSAALLMATHDARLVEMADIHIELAF